MEGRSKGVELVYRWWPIQVSQLHFSPSWCCSNHFCAGVTWQPLVSAALPLAFLAPWAPEMPVSMHAQPGNVRELTAHRPLSNGGRNHQEMLSLFSLFHSFSLKSLLRINHLDQPCLSSAFQESPGKTISIITPYANEEFEGLKN